MLRKESFFSPHISPSVVLSFIAIFAILWLSGCSVGGSSTTGSGGGGTGGSSNEAPEFASANSATFTEGTAGSFIIVASGTPAATIDGITFANNQLVAVGVNGQILTAAK
jgi:hypothetical protein